MTAPLLEMRNISKRYPGIQALRDVTLAIDPGEVHALVGENGAGKSTLMKILSGAERRDEGEIELDGVPLPEASPQRVRARGVSMIYQEFSLVPQLSVAANIFLGREATTALGALDESEMQRASRELLAQLHVDLDPSRKARTLSVAEQQLTEIARALAFRARVMIMDEPSATLTHRELENLFRMIRGLSESGVAVIYISHRLEEIFALATQVSVLRDGRLVSTRPVGELDRPSVIRMMVGRELSDEFPSRSVAPRAEILRVEGLSRRGVLHDVSFSLRAGEVVGVAGLVGSGRTELALTLYGAGPHDAGRVLLAGHEVHFRHPRQAIAAGVGLVTEDRQHLGLFLERPIRENVSISALHLLSALGWVRRRRERIQVDQQLEALSVRTSTAENRPRELSGGNQQKVLLARALLGSVKLLILDEPTRGIDVGAKQEIYELINALAARGVAILLISSELPEVLGMSDRLLVMRSGTVVGELDRAHALPERVMELATGGA